MLHFCTLFDSNYLTRGLAMIESLEKYCSSYHIYVFSFDDICYQILSDLKLKNVTIISLKEFENEELLKIKPTRTTAEYCWTCTPSVIIYSLNKFNLESCTYLDADIYFYSDPSTLFKEINDNSIVITKHNFSEKYKFFLTISGIYNVQFVFFKNNEHGMKVLYWWKEKCIEWCYGRNEGDKYGDQKYLDIWPTSFKGVHIMKNLGGGIAPWNVQFYEFTENNRIIYLRIKKDEEKFRLIFYHFHNFKIDNKGFALTYLYDLSQEIIDLIYKPYLKHLLTLQKKLKNRGLFDKGFVQLNILESDIIKLIQKKKIGDYSGDNIIIYKKLFYFFIYFKVFYLRILSKIKAKIKKILKKILKIN